MEYERSLRRYRNWYGKLVQLHSRPYYERFGEGMEQTFSDLLRERAGEGRGLFGSALGMFVETSGGIITENVKGIFMLNNNFVRIIIGTAVILMVPLVAMQFSDQVNWTPEDFVIVGIMLLTIGFAFELIARVIDKKYRVAAAIAAIGLAAYVWAELAVGIFTNLGS